MLTWIDGTLYPDTGVPDELSTLGDRVDFLARLCSAWDFGLLPDRETVEEIRRPDWLEVVEATTQWEDLPEYDNESNKWHDSVLIARKPEQRPA